MRRPIWLLDKPFGQPMRSFDIIQREHDSILSNGVSTLSQQVQSFARTKAR
jgi:hypothetical protein